MPTPATRSVELIVILRARNADSGLAKEKNAPAVTTPSKPGASKQPDYRSRQASELDPTIIEMIQKVLVAESSLKSIRTKSAQLNALIAPVHTLPDEILRMIFEEVVRTPQSEVLICPINRNAPPPLVLAAVSQRWRTVALGFPRLWTN